MSPVLLTVLFLAPREPLQYLTKAYVQAAFPVCMQLWVNWGSCSSQYIPGDKQYQTDSWLKQGKETLEAGRETEKRWKGSFLSAQGSSPAQARTQDPMNEPAGSPQWIPFTRQPAYIWGTTEASAFSASSTLEPPAPILSSAHAAPTARLPSWCWLLPGLARALSHLGSPWGLEQQLYFLLLLGLSSLPWFSLLFVCFSGVGVGIINKWFQ